MEAVMYVVKTGCQWRALPHDYPPYSTVYNFYSRAKQKGTWEKVMKFLAKGTRISAGKDAEPSYALIDSQSIKTAYRSDKQGRISFSKLWVNRDERSTLENVI